MYHVRETQFKNNICFNLFPKRTKIKIDVLDPFTLYDLSLNEFYKSEEELIGDFGKIIRKELLQIKDNVNLIQFNVALFSVEKIGTARSDTTGRIGTPVRRSRQTVLNVCPGCPPSQ